MTTMNDIDKQFPIKEVQTCYSCKYAFGEYVFGGENDIHVQCEHRYDGMNNGEIKWRDLVHHDEVCPLFEKRTGEMPTHYIVIGN